jgi:pimeloyl-ACP methyl ester carboxylesterase
MSDSRTLEHQGCRLAYEIEGTGSPVLLIQGVGVHGDGWLPQIEGLRDRYRLLSFDNRGMGRSQPQAGPLTVARMAEDARALMDAAGWTSAHVVGHSLGGLVAQKLALEYPERVRSLALLNTFARGADATRLTPWMLWTGLRTRIGPRAARRRAFLAIVMPPQVVRTADLEALAERLAPLFGHDLADQPAIVMKQLAAMKDCDLTPRLSELAGLPTLVLSGTHDRIAPPASGRAIATGIPGARYEEFPEAAHGLPIQLPDRVNVLLAEHFAAAEEPNPARAAARPRPGASR